GGRRRQAAGVDFLGIRGWTALEAGRQAQFRCRGRTPDGAGCQHSQNSLGQLPAEFFPGISARTARRRGGNLHDQLVSDGGTLAAFGATGIGWLLAQRLFSLEYTLDPMVWVAGLLCGTVLVGLSGTLATRSVINTPPIVTLRDD